MKGKWRANNSRPVYESEWVTVELSDVELPDGTKIEHHIVKAGKGGAGVVVHDPLKGVLMIWRHRLTGDNWGWEIPGGRIENNEKPEAAAAREVLEETGWKPGKLTRMLECQPMNGLVDHPYFFFAAEGATWEGPAADPNEAADIAWIRLADLDTMMKKGEISDGFTLTPLLWALHFGPLATA